MPPALFAKRLHSIEFQNPVEINKERRLHLSPVPHSRLSLKVYKDSAAFERGLGAVAKGSIL